MGTFARNRECFTRAGVTVILRGLLTISMILTFSLPVAAQEPDFVRDVHITVDDAVSYALEHSYTIRSAAVDLETKGDTANHILNALFPTVQASGTVARSNHYSTTYADLLNPLYQAHGYSGLPTSASSEADYWTAMGSLSVSLSYNGSLITDLRKAQEDYKAGQITFDQIRRQTERDIKKLFYAMLLSQKALENDRRSLENTLQRYQQAERSFNNGYMTRQDFLQARVTYQNMRRDIEKEEQAFSQQIDQFASILGLPAGSTVILDGELTADLKDFDEYELLRIYGPSNSQYVLADISLNSIDQQIAGLNLKTFTPTFSLNYSVKPTLYDFDANWFNPSNWTDAGNLNFTVAWDLTGLFPWSNNRIQYRNLQREKEKLEIHKEQITSQLWADMKKVLDDIDYAKKSITASEELISQAQQAYDLTAESYRNGRSDFLTVKDAETQLNKAKLGYDSDVYSYVSNIIELEYLLNLPQGWAEN